MTFEVAVSGLRAANQQLKVIGNNVANAGTTGFKLSRAEFGDVFAVGNLGISRNATGSGVTTQRVSQQFVQGNVGFTDRTLDFAINGEGFFVLDNQGERTFSRAGAFGTDPNGFIVNPLGHRLQGYGVDANNNVIGVLGDLQIPTGEQAPQASTRLTTRVNLNANDVTFDPADPATPPFDANNPRTFNYQTSTNIYDSLGNSMLVTSYYRKTGGNAWETFQFVDGVQRAGPTALSFGVNGALTAPVGGTITIPPFTPAGAAPINLTVDFSGTTQRGSGYAVFVNSADGYPAGQLAGIEVDQQGVLLARYTNGQSSVFGQVTLANFANTQGLSPASDTSWTETFASGQPLIGAPGSATLGLIQSGALEESNVDLSQMLVNLIIAQRNFQANAEVISTGDAITQTLINIR
jgi:flagellar hook protein FlgE